MYERRALKIFLGVALAALVPVVVLAGPPVFTKGIDYPGHDFGNIQVARPSDCARKCNEDQSCQAWTLSGTACYLKRQLPGAQANAAVTSGTRHWPFEPNVDRPGNDIGSVVIKSGDPTRCLDLCGANPDCVAFTILFSGANRDNMTCFLKDAVPAPVAGGSTLMSGVMANWRP